MDRVVPISEARANLGGIVTEAAEHEVYLLRHGRPVAVILSIEAYEAAIDRIEDLEDTVAVLQARAEGDYVPFTPSTFDTDQ